MFDTEKLVKAIQEDDTTIAEKEFANWLVARNEKGAIYLQRAILTLIDTLTETRKIDIIRGLVDYALYCERHINGEENV